MEFYTGKTGQDRVLRAIDFGTLDTAQYAINDIVTSGAIYETLVLRLGNYTSRKKRRASLYKRSI
jgi:hypothetical protein